MKRFSALMAALCMVLALAGCGKEEAPGVTYAEPAPLPVTVTESSLTQEESQLLQAHPELPHSQVYAFHTTVPVTHWKLILFRLENGAWEDIAGGSWEEFHWDWDQGGVTSGKLLIQFQNLWEDFTVSSQAGNQVSQSRFHPNQTVKGNSQVSYVHGVSEADFGELIPLVIQVTSLQDRLFTPDTDILEHPEFYENQDYESVFLLAMAIQQPENP